MADHDSQADSPGSVTWLFARFRDGDDAALDQLWQRFLPRLLGLARKVLARYPGPLADADDAVQEALVSFWGRTRAGAFDELANRDHLWGLLARFTVYKTGHLARRESAGKRGGGQVIRESEFGSELSGQALAELARQPATTVDQCAAELLEGLPEELQEFAVLRLLGHSSAEVAQLLNCTQRKVQRKLELVRLHWERRFETS